MLEYSWSLLIHELDVGGSGGADRLTENVTLHFTSLLGDDLAPGHQHVTFHVNPCGEGEGNTPQNSSWHDPILTAFALPCKTTYAVNMSTLVVSSKGQIVLPASTRRRLGLGAGSKLQVFEEGDEVRLRVVRSVPRVAVADLAGMVKLRARGVPRRLDDFDPASLTAARRRRP